MKRFTSAPGSAPPAGGILTVTATAGSASSSMVVQYTNKPTVSHPLVLPINSLSTELPMDVSVEGVSDIAGIVLFSPPEVLVDQPVFFGCLGMRLIYNNLQYRNKRGLMVRAGVLR